MFSLELRNRFWRDFPPHFLLMPLDTALLSPADLPKPIIPGAQESEKKIGFKVQMPYVLDSRRFLPYALATKQRVWAHFVSCHVLLLCIRSWKSHGEVCLSQVWHVDLLKHWQCSTPPLWAAPHAVQCLISSYASLHRNVIGRKIGGSCVPTSSRDLVWKHLSCTIETQNIPATILLFEDKITNDPPHLLRATTDIRRSLQDHIQSSASSQPEIRSILVCQGHCARSSVQCQLLSFPRNAQLGTSSCFSTPCVATALGRCQVAAVRMNPYYFWQSVLVWFMCLGTTCKQLLAWKKCVLLIEMKFSFTCVSCQWSLLLPYIAA